MKEVGGSGKQYYTPPVEYMPPLQSFGFVSKNLACEKCPNEFDTALQVVGDPCQEVHCLYLHPQSDLIVLWLFECWKI